MSFWKVLVPLVFLAGVIAVTPCLAQVTSFIPEDAPSLVRVIGKDYEMTKKLMESEGFLIKEVEMVDPWDAKDQLKGFLILHQVQSYLFQGIYRKKDGRAISYVIEVCVDCNALQARQSRSVTGLIGLSLGPALKKAGCQKLLKSFPEAALCLIATGVLVDGELQPVFGYFQLVGSGTVVAFSAGAFPVSLFGL